MSKFTHPLNNIKIASPCSADWNQMIGDERRRFCGDCKLNVYNLSGMSQREAENFLLDSEGRLCVRFYRRSDGTILTKDCPVGWKAIKQNISKTATAFASLVFAALGGIGVSNYSAKTSEPQIVETVLPTENLTVEESEINEVTDNNTALEKAPMQALGEISIENAPTTRVLFNTAEIRHQLRKKNNR